MLAAWLKEHLRTVWWLVFVASSAPALYLLNAYRSDGLGSNPLEMLLHTTGRSALVLLTVTLAVTPLRKLLTSLSRMTARRYGKRLADWNWLVRLRRLLGLWCFTYALSHGWIYLEFDLGYDWASAWNEVREKPYVAVGALALLVLVPLAATSTQGMIRRLGRNWLRLHMLTYLVAVLGLLHFWWLVKPGTWGPLPDTLVLTVLLGYRVLLRTGLLERWEGFDGREVPERPSTFDAPTTPSAVGPVSSG